MSDNPAEFVAANNGGYVSEVTVSPCCFKFGMRRQLRAKTKPNGWVEINLCWIVSHINTSPLLWAQESNCCYACQSVCVYRKDESFTGRCRPTDFPNLTFATCAIKGEACSTQLCDGKFVTFVLTVKSCRFMWGFFPWQGHKNWAWLIVRDTTRDHKLHIAVCTLASRDPGGNGNCVYKNLEGRKSKWAHSLSAERVAWYGHINGWSENSVHSWSTGSAGLQHGQHPNHLRGPTVSLLGAQYNHQVGSGGPFNHSANNSGGRICPWAQLRTPKSSR